MSISGAMSAGVSALGAQSARIGIISDNISNLNTTGYKRNVASFKSLVVNTSLEGGSYSPGGVSSLTRQIVDRQGLLQGTSVPTDLSISGNGMFVVNTQSDGEGSNYYTRAGSFRPNSQGYFVNTAGFHLMGWPLDTEERLPGDPGNLNTTSSALLDSLTPVTTSGFDGVATATSNVEAGANLNAGQTVYQGSGSTIKMDINNTTNYGITATDLIIPDTGFAVNGVVNGDQFTVTTGGGLGYTFTYGGYDIGRNIVAGPAGTGGTGNVFDASTKTANFFQTTTAPTGTNKTFTISTDTTGTVTFTYTQASPNVTLGQFNSLESLTSAINQVNGLTAKIVNNIMYVAPVDASEAMTFANGGTTDWVTELLFNSTTADADRFSTLQGLADLVNETAPGISAVVNEPASASTVELFVDDPLDTITIADAAGNTGSLLEEFGITNAMATGGPFAAQTTGVLSAAYDANDSDRNMAGGDITPHFTRNVRVYDALGTPHDLTFSTIKSAPNTWTVELYAQASEVTTSLVNGQIATGTITFNGDGSLRSVSSGLTQEITVSWTNNAQSSNITFDWGTAGQAAGTAGATNIGLTDGLSQFDADYSVSFINQDGAEAGNLVDVAVDSEGYVIASYTNGELKKLYKIPLADFNNPNALSPITGNAYSQTEASGVYDLLNAGSGGAGSIVSASLESSGVELAEELTGMIVAQRAYQASTKIISTADELLEELNRL